MFYFRQLPILCCIEGLFCSYSFGFLCASCIYKFTSFFFSKLAKFLLLFHWISIVTSYFFLYPQDLLGPIYSLIWYMPKYFPSVFFIIILFCLIEIFQKTCLLDQLFNKSVFRLPAIFVFQMTYWILHFQYLCLILFHSILLLNFSTLSCTDFLLSFTFSLYF